MVDIKRGYADPPATLFRYNGKPAIGLSISMKAGANLLEFGKALNAELEKATEDLPIGVGVHLVADQPLVVDHAIGHFTRSLFEAVVIVLAVSFLALGFRAGLIVALAIPLVLAMTFMSMGILDVTLQRVSLGALIIALGLLVDDAMIAIEMMIARLEKGDTLRQAALQVSTFDRVSEAHRHSVHHPRFHPHRPQQQRRRRVHLYPLRCARDRAAHLLDRGRHLHAAARLYLAAVQDRKA